jgi:hypothetical protein
MAQRMSLRSVAGITIVSGLPRSGTSMMMRMLEAGGMPILTDHIRKADEDNPYGYYEYELAKRLGSDTSWLEDAGGKAFKLVYRLLYMLPRGYIYRVIFMRRQLEEIIASQQKMLRHHGKETGELDEQQLAKWIERFQTDLRKVIDWLHGQENFTVHYVSYNDLLSDPEAGVSEIVRFVDTSLRIDAMVKVPDRALYRQRR